jgi:hypothetical protein
MSMVVYKGRKRFKHKECLTRANSECFVCLKGRHGHSTSCSMDRMAILEGVGLSSGKLNNWQMATTTPGKTPSDLCSQKWEVALAQMYPKETL